MRPRGSRGSGRGSTKDAVAPGVHLPSESRKMATLLTLRTNIESDNTSRIGSGWVQRIFFVSVMRGFSWADGCGFQGSIAICRLSPKLLPPQVAGPANYRKA